MNIEGPFQVTNVGNTAGTVRREQFVICDTEGRDVAATQFTYTVDGKDGEGPPIDWLRSCAYLLAAAPTMRDALLEIDGLLTRMAALHPSRPLQEVLPNPAGLSARLKLILAKTIPIE